MRRRPSRCSTTRATTIGGRPRFSERLLRWALTPGEPSAVRPRAELSRLQRIMGHASPETTSRYVHHDDHELAAEHRRIERLQNDPLARRQNAWRERAAERAR